MKFMTPGIMAKNEGETFKGDLQLSVGRISGTKTRQNHYSFYHRIGNLYFSLSKGLSIFYHSTLYLAKIVMPRNTL